MFRTEVLAGFGNEIVEDFRHSVLQQSFCDLLANLHTSNRFPYHKAAAASPIHSTEAFAAFYDIPRTQRARTDRFLITCLLSLLHFFMKDAPVSIEKDVTK
jgi:hypothetical protein